MGGRKVSCKVLREFDNDGRGHSEVGDRIVLFNGMAWELDRIVRMLRHQSDVWFSGGIIDVSLDGVG